MKFVQCSKCGLNLPKYLTRPAIIQFPGKPPRKAILCERCQKFLNKQLEGRK